MIKRIIALCLLLCLCFPAGTLAEGWEIHLTPLDSDVLSNGAQRALAQWLDKAYLTVHMSDALQQAALYYDGNMLLSAVGDKNTGTLTAGEYTAPIAMESFDPSAAWTDVLAGTQKLGETLKAYEKSAKATAELGGAVKAKTQLSYALSLDQWAEVWPAVAALDERLLGCTLESKATLRRYFDAEGREIGAYFYAEKLRIAEDDVREVRLEYAFQPDGGLYISFRCPNKNETRNLRISLTLKRTERTDRISYAVNGDIRHKHADGQDTLLMEGTLKEAEGILSGKATLTYTQKRGETSVKHALTIQPELVLASGTGALNFAYTRAGLQLLAGEIALIAAAEADILLPAVNARETQVTERLAYNLMQSLMDTDRKDQLELLYYLNRAVFLTGDEKDIRMIYDPEFVVTEEPDR